MFHGCSLNKCRSGKCWFLLFWKEICFNRWGVSKDSKFNTKSERAFYCSLNGGKSGEMYRVKEGCVPAQVSNDQCSATEQSQVGGTREHITCSIMISAGQWLHSSTTPWTLISKISKSAALNQTSLFKACKPSGRSHICWVIDYTSTSWINSYARLVPHRRTGMKNNLK